MKRKSSAAQIAKITGVSLARGIEATLKAQMIKAILKNIEKEHITHVELAKRSKIPRSAVTGILSGSLQKVTLDRVLKLVEAAGLTAATSLKNNLNSPFLSFPLRTSISVKLKKSSIDSLRPPLKSEEALR